MKKVLQSLDVCPVKNDKDGLFMSSALLAKISFGILGGANDAFWSTSICGSVTDWTEMCPLQVQTKINQYH